MKHIYLTCLAMIVYTILSFCQTNSGINASGEDIYSLARNFGAAGIATVSALGGADELNTYEFL